MSAIEAPTDDVVLSAEGLSLDFDLRTGPLHAVRNVSFAIRRGRTFCLVGESGSGKSVTARSLMRIVDKPGRVTSGRVVLNAEGHKVDITALKPDSREVRPGAAFVALAGGLLAAAASSESGSVVARRPR